MNPRASSIENTGGQAPQSEVRASNKRTFEQNDSSEEASSGEAALKRLCQLASVNSLNQDEALRMIDRLLYSLMHYASASIDDLDHLFLNTFNTFMGNHDDYVLCGGYVLDLAHFLLLYIINKGDDFFEPVPFSRKINFSRSDEFDISYEGDLETESPSLSISFYELRRLVFINIDSNRLVDLLIKDINIYANADVIPNDNVYLSKSVFIDLMTSMDGRFLLNKLNASEWGEVLMSIVSTTRGRMLLEKLDLDDLAYVFESSAKGIGLFQSLSPKDLGVTLKNTNLDVVLMLGCSWLWWLTNTMAGRDLLYSLLPHDLGEILKKSNLKIAPTSGPHQGRGVLWGLMNTEKGIAILSRLNVDVLREILDPIKINQMPTPTGMLYRALGSAMFSGLENIVNGRDLLNKLGMTEQRSNASTDFCNLQYQQDQQDQLLGKGSYGKVYKGMLDGKPVAVKEFIEQPKKKTSFDRESMVMARYRSPHLIGFFGAIENNNKQLLVMEFAAKGTLFDVRKRVYLNEPQIIHYGIGIALGLRFLHLNKLIHMDIKDSNILVDDNDQVRISDYGLTRTEEEAKQNRTFGSLRFMPPDVVVSSCPYTVKIDCYSWAAVMCTLFTNETPWEGVALNVVKSKLAKGECAQFKSEASRNTKEIATRCLQPDPTQRPSSQEIIESLQNILNDDLPRSFRF